MFSFLLEAKRYEEVPLRRTLNSICQQTETAWELCVWIHNTDGLAPRILKDYERVYGDRMHSIGGHCEIGSVARHTTGKLLMNVWPHAAYSFDALHSILLSPYIQDDTCDALVLPCGILDEDGTPIADASDQSALIWKRETLEDLMESDPKMRIHDNSKLLRACSVEEDRMQTLPTGLYFAPETICV